MDGFKAYRKYRAQQLREARARWAFRFKRKNEIEVMYGKRSEDTAA